MNTVDVTDQIDHDFNDGEDLPLRNCVCGAKFDLWTFTISVYPDHPTQCPECGAKLYWISAIRVMRVIDDREASP